jgi:hypothetical protein
LAHGTIIQAAKAIMLEGVVRLADRSYNKDLSKSELPSFGGFYIGQQIGRADSSIPEYAMVDLLDRASKKGKGQPHSLWTHLSGCISTHQIGCWRQ